ncbi:MAG TPA: HNH endonuclease [Gammaproteobacteria bacterium]|nr:HNH endonuclease [Gammaproteobacteria bacterium]
MTATLSDFHRVPRILRLNIAGQPVEWVSWQDAVCLYSRDLVSWTIGDPLLTLRGGHSRVDSCTSVVEIHSIIACQGRVVSRSSHIPPLTNQALFGRDGNLCLYCGKHFSDQELSRDHVLPVSKGGQDTWDNVVACCRRCNHFKGDRLLESTSLELLALPYVPNFAEYLALINSGRILGDQMAFLRKSFGSQSRLKEPAH